MGNLEIKNPPTNDLMFNVCRGNALGNRLDDTPNVPTYQAIFSHHLLTTFEASCVILALALVLSCQTANRIRHVGGGVSFSDQERVLPRTRLSGSFATPQVGRHDPRFASGGANFKLLLV